MTLRSNGAVILSLGLLGFLTWYFFVLPRPVAFEEPPGEQIKKITVLLEGAEVAKITERGKEWTLRAPRIEKHDDTVVLFSISGAFLGGGSPLYEVQAGSGTVDLATSTVVLEKVELRRRETGEYLRGERLVWEGKAQEFLMEGVTFSGREFSAQCDELVYNVAGRKASFRGNVVVRLEMEKR